MADHSKEWHNGTSSQCISSDKTDGLAAIQAQLNNLGRGIKKFRVPFPQGGRNRAAAPGFYQRDNGNPLYQKRRQTMEESLSKFMAESAKWHNENSNLINEIRASTDAANEQGIDKILFLVDFIVLDMLEDIKVPLILGRPFLSTAHVKIDMRNQELDDLGPTIKEGEVINELNGDIVKTRDDNVTVEKIDEYPTRRFDGFITIYTVNDSMTYQMARTHPRFKHLSNEQCNIIRPLLKVSARDKLEGKSHPYQKLKDFYKGVLNLGPEYIKDEKKVEWLTRGHVSMHEMD
ncbi:putative reverse transcriptase domain-containing protein [Tanacetum coccineum]|uniref:Reverse transcriptase domain-containing protein n=1 Tax=Tanacetum coccineum TaxID=301880 RepID=A0ABQ4WS75_9ASTR